MKRILFQGDSITDAGRARDDMHLGRGYASFVSAKLGFEEPGIYEFINRGISGNRVVDLYARIKADFINLVPEYLSIMIGVNDVWHEIDSSNGVDAEKFERVYSMLIEEIKTALPDLNIMLIEPYVLPASGTVGTLQDGGDKYTLFRNEVEKRAAATMRVAKKYGLVFIPLQKKLDELTTVQPAAYWTEDGVHPTNAGHEFISREWIDAFRKNFK